MEVTPGTDVRETLRLAIEEGASDIFAVAGLPLTLKIRGGQKRLGECGILTPQRTREFAREIYEIAQREPYCLGTQTDDDFSFSLSGIGRFRVNLFRQRGSLAAVVRVIRFGLPDAKESHIPDEVMKTAAFKKGIVLVTGPAGSGKSTTLACILNQINETRSGHILTLEDPVEYSLPGINQVAVNRRSGMTFAKGLRAIVRQDPDVIMLGEIRDEETAGIAVQAALTGHLVLSTLHTNSAAGAVYRLLDMGIAPYLLAAALRGVVAQRLVRRLCPACRRQRTATAAEHGFLGAATVWEQQGCEQCQAAGYRGRVAVQEVLPLTTSLQQLVLQRAPVEELEHAARAEGLRSLAEDAAAKALDGLTTVQELWRVGITGGQDAV